MANIYKRFLGACARIPSRTWGEVSLTSIDITDAIDGDLMVVVGDPLSVDRPLVRVHSECVFAEVFDSALCDCADQLRMAMTLMRSEGNGVLFYLRLDGRGEGLSAKVKATELELEGVDTFESHLQLGLSPDSRSFRRVGEYMLGLGFARIRLLTNNPRKAIDLQETGLDVEIVGLKMPEGDENIRLLYASKAAKFGHVL